MIYLINSQFGAKKNRTKLDFSSLSDSVVATGLEVSRVNLSALVNERACISPELAIKLSEAFGNTAQIWINLQKNYGLWHAEKKVNRKKIRHFMPT